MKANASCILQTHRGRCRRKAHTARNPRLHAPKNLAWDWAAQPPLSLDAQLGSYASTAGDEEYEDEGEEIDEEAMEEARAEAAAVITEQLTQRMAAVTEL